MFRCEKCEKEFFDKSTLTRHQKTSKTCSIFGNIKCAYCKKIYTSMTTLRKHVDKCAYYQFHLEKQELLKQQEQLLKEKEEEKQQLILSYEQRISKMREDENKFLKKQLDKEPRSYHQYIINMFPNAPAIDKPLRVLTNDRMQQLYQLGPQRALEGALKDIYATTEDQNRSFWLVDNARKKWSAKIDERGWKIDTNGDAITRSIIGNIVTQFKGYLKPEIERLKNIGTFESTRAFGEIYGFLMEMSDKDIGVKALNENRSIFLFDKRKYTENEMDEYLKLT